MNRVKAFFLQEVSLPKSPRFREITALLLLLLAVYLYNQDFPLGTVPGSDLAGSIAGFCDFKSQWFAEGAMPLWLPRWFAGMINVHSLSEFFLVFPLSLLMPAVTAYKLLALLAVAVGSLGVFRLLRLWGADRISAFVGGLIFFSHPLVLVETRFFGHVAFLLTLAVLPFFIQEIYLVCQQPGRPLLWGGLMLAFIFSLHVAMGLMVTFMVAGIALVVIKAHGARPSWSGRAMAVGIMVAAAFGLSAFANLPFWIEARKNLWLFGQNAASSASKATIPLPSVLFFFDRMGALFGGSEAVRQAMGNTPLLAHYPISSGGFYLGWTLFLITMTGAACRRREHGFSVSHLGLVWLLMAWMALGDRGLLGSYRWLQGLGAVGAARLTLAVSLLIAVWAFTLAFGPLRLNKKRQLLGSLVFLAAAVAIFLLPGFTVLRTLVPFFRRMRAPCQFLVPAFVLLPVLGGAAVQEIRLHLRRPLARGAVTIAIVLLLLADFYPYSLGALNEVSGFRWPELVKMTAFLRQQPGRGRVFYAYAYRPYMDYALSEMAGKSSFSYWLNWGAPRYMGSYRAEMYNAFARWLETGEGQEWKRLAATADIRFVVVPCFEMLLPRDPALEKIFHTLLFDVYRFKGAGGRWRLYPAAAPEPASIGSSAATLIGAGPSLGKAEPFGCKAPDDTAGRIVRWGRPVSTRSWAEVELAEPALLLWSESYHPAWRVSIDGRDAELLRARFAFVGVRVPPGRHRIVFHFGPYPWRWLGMLVSLASLGVLLPPLWWSPLRRGLGLKRGPDQRIDKKQQ